MTGLLHNNLDKFPQITYRKINLIKLEWSQKKIKKKTVEAWNLRVYDNTNRTKS